MNVHSKNNAMNRKIIRLASTASLFLLFFSGKAQESIGFVSTSFASNTVALGDTIFFTTKLFNYDNGVFDDTIGFNLSVNGVLVNNPAIFPNPLAGQILNIAGNDSFPVSFFIVATGPQFLAGPDGLVVWPIVTDSLSAHDSIFYQINILATAINEPIKDQFSISNNRGQLDIKSNSAIEPNVYLKLYNISGATLISSQENLPAQIPTNNLSSGIYFLEIQTKNDRKNYFKFSVH